MVSLWLKANSKRTVAHTPLASASKHMRHRPGLSCSNGYNGPTPPFPPSQPPRFCAAMAQAWPLSPDGLSL